LTRLLLATRNRGKVRELLALLGGESFKIVTLTDYPQLGDVDETGSTFEDNARLKAKAAATATGEWSLGEDSGLEVDALNGRPGIHSARYSGVHGDDAANNHKLMRELDGCEDRSARYVCAIALARPSGEIIATTRGVCEGHVGLEPRGQGGFGYDPYFIPEAMPHATAAELEPAIKDALSHRGQALRAMLSVLRMHLGAPPQAPADEAPTVR